MKTVPLAIVVGTGLQQRISLKLFESIRRYSNVLKPEIVSLENYYRFNVQFNSLKQVQFLNSFISIPWYDRGKVLKIVSLFQFVFQLLLLSRRYRYFLFFVDTGVLEKTAIVFLKRLGCRTIVLQDALKRYPKHGNRNSLTWFGSGGADLYLLLGERFAAMISKGKTHIVGSPIYDNRVDPITPGKNILIINQCFSRYGETTRAVEIEFIREVVESASEFANIELRLHPHNEIRHYEDLVGPNVKVTIGTPLSDSLSSAGIVLCVNSTVILEALAKDLPVVLMRWHPSPFYLPIKGGVLECENIDDLKKYLRLWKQNYAINRISINAVEKELKSSIAYTGESALKKIIVTLENFTAPSVPM